MPGSTKKQVTEKVIREVMTRHAQECLTQSCCTSTIESKIYKALKKNKLLK